MTDIYIYFLNNLLHFYIAKGSPQNCFKLNLKIRHKFYTMSPKNSMQPDFCRTSHGLPSLCCYFPRNIIKRWESRHYFCFASIKPDRQDFQVSFFTNDKRWHTIRMVWITRSISLLISKQSHLLDSNIINNLKKCHGLQKAHNKMSSNICTIRSI